MTCQRLSEMLKNRHNVKASPPLIVKLMKRELGLSFKGVQVLSLRTNVLRSLRLRQLYAQ